MLAAMLPGLRIATCARKVSPGLLGAATVQTEAQFELLPELTIWGLPGAAPPHEKHSEVTVPLATLSPSSSTPVVMLAALAVWALKVANVPPGWIRTPAVARTIRATRICFARPRQLFRSAGAAAVATRVPTVRGARAGCQRRGARRGSCAGEVALLARVRTVLAEPQAVQRKETSAARSTLFSCPQRLQGIRIVAFISFTSFFALGASAIRLLVRGPGEGHGRVLALVAVDAGVREGDVDHEVPGHGGVRRAQRVAAGAAGDGRGLAG